MTKEGSTSTELEDEGYTQLVRELTRHTEHGELDDEIALRVENLARSLSQATTRDGEHSVPDADIDIHAALTALVRDAKRQNIESRRTGVILDGITVLGVDTSLSPSMDYGDVLLFPRTIARATFAKKQTRVRRILDDVDILVRPGEMLLVLGRPGAGCSSLLKTVAGVTKQFNAIEGDISYDGIGQEEMLRKYSSEVIYNGEQDVHFPHLTVKQTLDFALACKTPHVRINGISRKEHIQMMRDLYATIFGLRHAYNTKVGNDFVRGVSGGERKRVSIAEALAASGSIYCWDNATRGLDASTALEYAQAIRLMTNLLMSTTLVTIYQASERIYESFDKVTILYEGRQIYFGDVLSAKAYFENLGYECPPRQSTSEFLTSLTDINGYHLIKSGYENRVPRTADEFAACWRQSVEYKNLKEEIIDYKEEVDINATKQQFDRYKSQAKSKYARNQSSYTISFLEQAQLCLKRGLQRIYGDKSFTITNIVAGIIQAVITGTLYHKTPSGTSGAFSRSGVMYVSVLYYSLIGLSSINLSSRPILQKHMNYMLYHPSAEALTSNLAAFPFRLLGMVIFYVILYFLSGLTASAGRFFMGFFFLLLSAEAVNLLFEAVAAMCDTMAQAASICGIIMLAISLYSTYLIQTPSMHPWFKWISYVLPLRYSFEGMLNSEFHNRHLSCDGNYIPVGEGYEGIPDANRVCAFLGSKPGAPYVLGDDYLKANYSYAYAHQWRNVGILLIFIIGFMAIKCIATEFKNPVKGTGDTLVFTKSSFYKHSVKKMDEEAAVEKNEPDSKVLVSSETNKAFEGLRNTDVFIWKQVSFSIPHRGSYLQLLDDITGYCVPGTLTALMGESGAGKTTLLNTLAQRNVGIITGDMLVNGFPINSSFQRRTGYVQQQDIHVKEMTVRESLIFSARLRRQQSVPDAEKVDYVETIINVLGMESYADAFVGDIGSGLSVEQRKKLSIGVELVAKPSLLLFLDEPTSGLDSQSSWAIVQLLKKLARAGQSILCTIHQPSATLFEQFDRLLLLKKGGQTVYFGDIGDHSAVVLDYFQRNGARNCEAHENPAEYILEAIGAGATAEVEQDWSQTWRESPEFIKSNEEVNRMIEDLSQTSKSHSDELESTFATSYWYQFRYVMQRSAAILYRDMDYIVAKQMLFITGGLFIGFTFWDVGSSMKGLQNSMFAAFISVILSAPAINQIQERAIKSKELYDVRESKSNMFHWSLLMITQYLAELPYHLVFSTICFVCMFFTLKAGVSATNTAIYFLNYCLLFQLYYVGLGLFVLYLAPDLGSANIMLGLMLTLLLSFCGVTQPADLLPKFWKFMYYATPYTYFLQNFLGLILHNKKVVCKPSEMSILNPPTGMTCGQYLGPFVNKSSGYINNPDATADCAYCLYKVGDEYLSHVSSKFSYLWRNFGLLWLYVAFNIVAMIFSYWFFFVQTTFKLPSFSILKKKLSRS